MKTAMQDLRQDLEETKITADEVLNEIIDDEVRQCCKLTLKKTLVSICNRIDDELLEIEKQQKEDFAIGFAEWIDNNYYQSNVYNSWSKTTSSDAELFTAKQLLEIYKKEKGL